MWFIHIMECYSALKKKETREFPGGPVVRTPCSHCRGPRFNSWLGNLEPTSPVVGQKKKKKETLTPATAWMDLELKMLC